MSAVTPAMPEGLQPEKTGRASVFPRCGNPACSTGWMHLWRSRRVPAFESRWACSPACMRALIARALRRESSGAIAAGARPAHRVPIGLLLVEQGSLTGAELQRALQEWRRWGTVARHGGGEDLRLGQWLITSGLLTETALTRALSAQWSCPRFSLLHYRPEETASVMPRILVEAFGAVPVRAAAGGLVYLAFRDGVDRSMSYAVERATDAQVVCGMAGDAAWRRAQEQYLATPGPPIRCLEGADLSGVAAAVAARIEQKKPVEARLVRVHQDYWLRLWYRASPRPGLAGRTDVEDVLCIVRAEGRTPRLEGTA